ncbi:MAG: hypothetical protein ACTH2Q_17450 [Propionibacteriaceae bacterium]
MTCAALAVVLGRVDVPVPLAEEPVVLGMFVGVFATSLVLVPLMSAFPELEGSLPREAGTRAIRVALSGVLLLGVLFAAHLSCPPGPEGRMILVLPLALSALGMLAVCVIGEIAWAPPMGLGLVLIIVDGTVDEPVTSVMQGIPVRVILGAWAMAAVILVWRGPRGSR